MKTRYTAALAMFAGFGLGAFAVQGLHAQAKPPVYSVAEIDIVDQAAYSDYVPKAQAAIKAAGGKIIAAGGKITTIEGEPPKARVVIQQWDGLEKFQAYRDFSCVQGSPTDPAEGSEIPVIRRRGCPPIARRTSLRIDAAKRGCPRGSSIFRVFSATDVMFLAAELT